VGELKFLWSPIVGHSTGTLANRVLLRLMGVRGNGSDDAFVEGVARKLLGVSQTIARRPRSGESRVLARLRHNNTEAIKHFYPWLHDPSLWANWTGCASAAPLTTRAAQAEARKIREAYVPAVVDAEDKKLLETYGNAAFTLPLYATTAAQWRTDMAIDNRRSQRAQTWAMVSQD